MLYTALVHSWHPTRCDKCTGYCCPVTLAALEADGTVQREQRPDGGVELAKENFLQRLCLNNAAYVVTPSRRAVVARENVVAQAWHSA